MTLAWKRQFIFLYRVWKPRISSTTDSSLISVRICLLFPTKRFHVGSQSEVTDVAPSLPSADRAFCFWTERWTGGAPRLVQMASECPFRCFFRERHSFHADNSRNFCMIPASLRLRARRWQAARWLGRRMEFPSGYGPAAHNHFGIVFTGCTFEAVNGQEPFATMHAEE